MTRDKILSEAVDRCLKEIYEYVQPKVDWKEFVKENKIYSNRYAKWEEFNRAFRRKEENIENWEIQKKLYQNWVNKGITECIGPHPYEFYYLPKDILKDIVDSYIHSYKMDIQQNLLDIIEVLKNYCKEPIIDKYIDDWTDETGFHHPGYRSYDHPDNLEKEITKILGPEAEDNPYHVHKICDKFFEFLDMAGKFYNWNSELNSFSISIYLGPAPNSNKEAVIKNWKEYRRQDIEINEEQIKKEYYGEEY